jgi:hypothetical protein
MDATREDLVRFVSDVRLVLEGPDGSKQDPEARVQTTTLDRLLEKLSVLQRTTRRQSGVSAS